MMSLRFVNCCGALVRRMGLRGKAGLAARRRHLRCCWSGLPPIILVDFRMPGHNGFWLIERVRARWPKTVIIMAIGAAEMDTVLKSKRAGAVDYVLNRSVARLAKPWCISGNREGGSRRHSFGRRYSIWKAGRFWTPPRRVHAIHSPSPIELSPPAADPARDVAG